MRRKKTAPPDRFVQLKERRSPCPLACVLDLIGDRWTLLVVRDLACGKSQFKDFLASPERIATNILSDRLSRLLEAGLASRRPLGPGRDAYELSPAGRSLLPAVQGLADWGLSHIKGTEARLQPVL
mgnify:FL=1